MRYQESVHTVAVKIAFRLNDVHKNRSLLDNDK